MDVLTPVLAAILAMSAVGLVIYGATRLKEPDQIQGRLETFTTQIKSLEEMELEQPFYERAIKPVVLRISTMLGKFTPANTMDQIRRDLQAAGNPNGWGPNEFLGIKGGVAVAIGGIALFFVSAAGGPAIMSVFAFPVGAILGFYLPNFHLKSKIAARTKELQLALPDALDLLSICVEAGLGFDLALQRVAAKWDNALTAEFRRVLTEIGIGKTRREALRDLSERTQVADIQSFVAAIIQADQLGVPISRILTLQAEQMRLKRRQRAEKQAHQAPILMLIPMALFMLPAIYIVILGPMVPKLVTMMSGG